MFMTTLLVFLIHRNHFLMMLLSLEMIVVILYFILYIYFYSMFNELFFLMIYLTMSVCEGVLGLSILVSMVRVHGNDYVMSFTFLW
uniref:NADH-ubiquinone oxidoreductase chain 4L n=2 Tax=Oulema TaxID=41131 RepID=A0A343C3G2_9CUCU|nr:NADH dehydrogenase subunit 4L [Oulema erichsonii]ARH54555.1 NADH dehydrogenase subunit 4L [Oulema melanopus]